MPNNLKPEIKARSISAYILLAAALFVFVESFSLLSPILLSLLLIQDVGHPDEKPRLPAFVNVPRSSPPLAGFQLSLVGRFWVSTEGPASGFACCRPASAGT